MPIHDLLLKAWIQGNKVVVQSDKLASPVYVRYLFRKPEPDPAVSLINAEGLPASPFMTDDFMPPRTTDGSTTPITR